MSHAGWVSRGYLPHCDGAGLIQHIVFATVGAGDEIQSHFGAHFMRGDAAATLVQAALLHFDGERYRVLAWCVMPNHVHVVIEQFSDWPLARVVHGWKSFTANGVNRLLGRTGPVWVREYFDRFMRSDDHLANTIAYVHANPVAAGLVASAERWRWSSAFDAQSEG
ncbi:MAG: transposase [Terricaulis sp.]